MSDLLCALGHLASLDQLRAHGVTPARIRARLAVGDINRIRRGTYACAHLSGSLSEAARIGGAVTCVSVLREADVWAGHSHALHIMVPPTASRLPAHHALLHWEAPRFEMESRWRAGRMQALSQAVRCLDFENSVAAAESALHEEFLTEEEVRTVLGGAGSRLRDASRTLVVGSGSGNETIVRLRLAARGHVVVPQGRVPGMGHQDLVVDDCIGLEVDGRKWHGEDRFATDRDRDIQAESLGRHVLRIRASHIHETWSHTLFVIERAVDDARRERRARHGRVLIAADDPL